MRTVRTIEQGMGRSVRGEKDYCVVIALGHDLVRLLQSSITKRYLSPQMAAQIDLGVEIAKLAKQEIEEDEKEPFDALKSLIDQCLRRDADWKAFYVEQMDQVVPRGANETILRTYAVELKAEEAHAAGDDKSATEALQTLIDGGCVDSDDDKGWYLQEMARYHWRTNPVESNHLQVTAHTTACCY